MCIKQVRLCFIIYVWGFWAVGFNALPLCTSGIRGSKWGKGCPHFKLDFRQKKTKWLNPQMIQEILYLGECHKRRRQSLCIKVTKKSSIFSCYTNFLRTAQGVICHWLHLSCLWLVRCPRHCSCPRWVAWWSLSACAIPWFEAPAWFPIPQVRSGRCRAGTSLRRLVSAKRAAWLVLRCVQGRVAVLAGCIIPGKDDAVPLQS